MQLEKPKFTFKYENRILLTYFLLTNTSNQCISVLIKTAYFVINKMDPAEKTTIEQRLVETGEKERLKEHLRTRLTESGWREELKLHAREVVRTRGLNNIKHEDLVKEITPKGRALVPDVVKKELLIKIQAFLAQQHNM